MVTRRLKAVVSDLKAQNKTVNHIKFGTYKVTDSQYASAYDVQGNETNQVIAYLDGDILRVTNADSNKPVTFEAGDSLSFDSAAEFNNIKTIAYDNVDTSKVTTTGGAFKNLQNVTSISGLEKFNTSNVTNMAMMFQGCQKLTSVNVQNWNTQKVTNMQAMFNGCSDLQTADVSKWDVSNVQSVAQMFNGCQRLKVIDVSKWNLTKATKFQQLV